MHDEHNAAMGDGGDVGTGEGRRETLGRLLRSVSVSVGDGDGDGDGDGE